MELKSKVAIITGAGRGIGRSIALSLANEGCKVTIVGRSKTQLKEVELEIKKKGGEALSIVVDILINNAGILRDTPFLEVTKEEWDYVMNTNLKAVFLLSQAALQIMKEKRKGYIINISSTVALQVPATLTTYGTSKVGVIGLSQALYETAKVFGVKVSIIYPGMTDTKMLRDFNPPVDPSRWMLPEDIAGCIVFLLKQSDRVVIKDLIPWATRYDKV